MNKMIQKFKFFILSCIVVGNITMLLAQNPNPQPGPIPGFPQMSEVEMKQLEAELGELNKMLEGLSPEAIAELEAAPAPEEVEKMASDRHEALKDLVRRVRG